VMVIGFLGTSVRCRGSISIEDTDISDGGAGRRLGTGVGSNIISGSGVGCFLVGSAGPGGSSIVGSNLNGRGGSGVAGVREKLLLGCWNGGSGDTGGREEVILGTRYGGSGDGGGREEGPFGCRNACCEYDGEDPGVRCSGGSLRCSGCPRLSILLDRSCKVLDVELT
jgi:hypothetical protein